MALLLKDSPECAKSELNLFTLPPTQTVIERGRWVEFHPIANITDGGPIEFNISGSGEDYLDLSHTRLHVRAKIVKADDKPLTDEDVVGPVNLFFHSLFSQVDVSMNERVISSSSNTYPYRAIIETLLNHGYDSKTSHLTAELFYKDTAGSMNSIDGSNAGFTKRADMFKLSSSVDMMGRLHVDMFHQDRLLMNMVDLKIKLIRSKPEFCLIGKPGAYKVVLEHVSLFVRKTHVNPAVLLGHAKALEKTTAKYPIDRVVCKVYSIPQGSMSFVQDSVFTGQMPKRVVLACVDSTAFAGTISQSPFEFKHHHMSYLGLYVDGQPMPHQPLELDFERNRYIHAYQNLFLNTEGLYLTREEFAHGYSLFLFDLTPDLCDAEHFSLIRHSNLRIESKFTKPLEKTVSFLVFAEFESLIEINKARNVIFDFGN